jgi:thioredoxin 1
VAQDPPGAEDDEVARLRALKIKRYQRLQRLKAGGLQWPELPVEVATHEAAAFVKTYPVAMLEFWASWSRPSLTIRPIVDELAAEYWGDVAFGRVDLDRNPEAREVWGVTVLPTLLITKHALEVARLQGAVTRPRLVRELAPFAAAPDERTKRVGHSDPPGA